MSELDELRSIAARRSKADDLRKRRDQIMAKVEAAYRSDRPFSNIAQFLLGCVEDLAKIDEELEEIGQ